MSDERFVPSAEASLLKDRRGAGGQQQKSSKIVL